MPDAGLGVRGASASRVTGSSFSDAAVFHLQGRLDRDSAAGLRRELGGAAGKAMVLFDLTGVVFIDSIGVGVLLGAIRNVHEHGGVAAIGGADVGRGIAEVLQMAGVERLAFLSESAAGAMQWLRQAG